MTAHDESLEGRHGFVADDPGMTDFDGWADAPEPSWVSEDDEDVESTSGVPSFDLGPHTGSYVVDLTGPQAVVTGAAAGNGATPATDSQEPVAGSRRKAPTADIEEPAVLPNLEPTPDPPVAQVPVTAPVARDPFAPIAAENPYLRPSFDIPPVPQGSAHHQAESLTAATVLRTRKPRPQSGWRKGVLRVTGGRFNLGPSPLDLRRADLVERARTPVSGCHRVAVISLKGGVGKTTTTAALGAMFANLRGDRVIAVDANPDRGTLIERVPRESGATVRHLLQSRDRVQRYGDVRAFTSQSATRLEVLASDADPSASSALSERDYRDTVETLERFYNLILTDCGTGLLHEAMRGVLGLAHSLVVVSSASLDGARSASATLDWLEAHGMEAIAKDAVVVISSVRPGGGIVDVMQLEDHFAARCRAVVTIPYDPHLEAGGVLDIEELDEETLDAYRELAAAVGEGFAQDARA